MKRVLFFLMYVSLIAAGLAEPNVSDKNVRLIQAAGKGDLQTVQTLLAGGAEVNTKNARGVTVLIIAAMNGHTEIVKLLLEKGAEVNAKASNGKTALELAKSKGHTDVVQLLEKAVVPAARAQAAKISSPQDANAIDLDCVREALLKTPPTLANNEQRRLLLASLDACLEQPSSEYSERVIKHYQLMIDHAIDEIATEKVSQGIIVWKFYSSGMVVKTPKTVFGIDLIGPSYFNHGLGMNDQQRSRLAKLVDISFHTHIHGDHIERALTEELFKAGKMIVVPDDIREKWSDKSAAAKFIVLAPESGRKHSVGNLKVEVLASWQLDSSHKPWCPCNAYLVTTDNGVNVLFKGDINYGDDLLPWLSQVKSQHEKVDLYVSAPFIWMGGGGIHEIDVLFNPLIIPGHEFEFGHRQDGQSGPGTQSYSSNIEAFKQQRSVILSWGEKFHYLPSMRGINKEKNRTPPKPVVR